MYSDSETREWEREVGRKERGEGERKVRAQAIRESINEEHKVEGGKQGER